MFLLLTIAISNITMIQNLLSKLLQRQRALLTHNLVETRRCFGSRLDNSKFRGLRKLFMRLPSATMRSKQCEPSVFQVWLKQCMFILAQRLRRSQQTCSLYWKLWEVKSVRDIVTRYFVSRGEQMALYAVCLSSLFNWNTERISDEEMASHLDDIEAVYKLQEVTLRCAGCGLRTLIDIAVPAVEYCKCSSGKAAGKMKQNVHYEGWTDNLDGEEWVPFIDQVDVVVWRKEHALFHGHYIYKVYCHYNDVSAEDFLKVQLDTSYRKEWDNSTVDLSILDVELETQSEVLYWEMAWPRLFSNRDYVFKRRVLIDEANGKIVICSQSTVHPLCPPKSGLYRVTDYWSSMVIKPTHSVNEPGIEFTLTYFDHPGLTIPATAASWVAAQGLPNYLEKLRHAALSLRKS